jgi:hypothetical protein
MRCDAISDHLLDWFAQILVRVRNTRQNRTFTRGPSTSLLNGYLFQGPASASGTVTEPDAHGPHEEQQALPVQGGTDTSSSNSVAPLLNTTATWHVPSLTIWAL